jgi:ArsR family transcriptional regulator, arsenate/arsenite/antimonite-responsive transcriptional repressor
MIEISDKQGDALASGCCDPMPVHPQSEAITEQVKLLAALSDATRLQIVAMLAGLDEPLCVCEIQAHFRLGQPTISHHLKVLRDARLVTWEKRGLWVYYSLDRATLEQATSYLGNLLSLSKSATPAG